MKKKKKIAILAAAVMAVSMLTACGKDATYLSGIDVSKYVTLGEYKGIEVTVAAPADEDAIAEYVEYYIETYLLEPLAVTTDVTDRTVVEEGDTVNIDYTGYRDGVAFDNGSAQGASLTIGSGAFIPGFEDGLIGVSVGETVTLELTFPETYSNNPDLAGAAVEFEVTVNGISIVDIPELTDEIATEATNGEYNTTEELRAALNELMYTDVMDMYEETVGTNIMDAVMANCIFKEPPEKMTERYYNAMVDLMTEQASAYGMDLDTYMYNRYYTDKETYEETFKENSVTSAQQYIMFQAIADVEGLNVSDEEFNNAMSENAATYGYASVEELKEEIDEEEFREYLMAEKVMDFLVENAVVKNE
ncbi:MAG: trigger factor [Butyrivibrio sp.]|nr:trigger factor [Butyrivibrio sp.]